MRPTPERVDELREWVNSLVIFDVQDVRDLFAEIDALNELMRANKAVQDEMIDKLIEQNSELHDELDDAADQIRALEDE